MPDPSPAPQRFYAHTRKDRPESEWEPLEEHLNLVQQRAMGFARIFGAETDAAIAGFFHDLGKGSPLFLKRLQGKESKLDHWTPGALAVCKRYGSVCKNAIQAILGHHAGLPDDLIKTTLENAARMNRAFPPGEQLRLTLSATQNLKEIVLAMETLESAGHTFPVSPQTSASDSKLRPLARMLDTRMLFSTLVDADFLETEAWFDGTPEGPRRHYRGNGPALCPQDAISLLLEHIKTLSGKAFDSALASKTVLNVRRDLLESCLQAAESPSGLFTLTAPTGAGKTLAMLAFALKHAARNNLRRVVVVIPFLSIIEQTARIYREIFEPHFGPNYVLEHHSMTGASETGQEARDEVDKARRLRDQLAENWDAPLIVTTSVQALESLFAHRPGPCRKLHRMARSVILFDEVQTLPPKWVQPILGSLAHLTTPRYGTSIVFSTATQPAFTSLSAKVEELGGYKWEPVEIAAEPPRMFSLLKRTRIDVSEIQSEKTRGWDEIAEELAGDEYAQVLCIVNLKRHAARLFEALGNREAEGTLHLSTSMCPAHRDATLREVKRRLEEKSPCRLVSTQCVEAGVDVDFPCVWRALGPLEAIIQAAGRCNRNGTREGPGHVHVFKPRLDENEKSLYPPGYGDAACEAESLIRSGRLHEIDTSNLELIRRYYANLYDAGKAEMPRRGHGGEETFPEALEREGFATISTMFRLIEKDAINVLVPYDFDTFDGLRNEALKQGRITRDWVAKARPYTVGIFVGGRDRQRLQPFLLPIKIHGEESDWWYLADSGKEYYDNFLGLKTPPEWGFCNF
jgi:CRISPR-associated helicase Cas3/CRISPR-associated endonuclease Cas3-HD